MRKQLGKKNDSIYHISCFIVIMYFDLYVSA